MLYFDTMAQIAIAVGFLLTNNVKKFMSKILAILAKNLDSWPGSTLSWSRLPRSWPRSIRFFRWYIPAACDHFILGGTPSANSM